MDSFILHTEDADMIKALPDKQRLLLYDSIFSFAESDGAIEAPKNAAVKIAYIAITRRIAADHERYKAKCATNKENGKKGGRPRKEKHPAVNDEELPEKTERFSEKPNGFSEKPNETLYDYDYDHDFESDFESDNETDYRPDCRPDQVEPSVGQSTPDEKLQAIVDQAPTIENVQQKYFSPTPTLDEVMQEFKDRPSETVRKAFEHYQSTGWTDSSGRPVKAWKKVLGRFIDGERPDRQTRQTRWKNFNERNQDYDQIQLQIMQKQNEEMDALEGGTI